MRLPPSWAARAWDSDGPVPWQQLGGVPKEMVRKARPSELGLTCWRSHATGVPFFGGNTQKLLNMNARLQNQSAWALQRLGPGASSGCSVLVTQQKPLREPLRARGQTDVGTDTHPRPPLVVQTPAQELPGSDGCLGQAPREGVLAGVGREGCTG